MGGCKCVCFSYDSIEMPGLSATLSLSFSRYIWKPSAEPVGTASSAKTENVKEVKRRDEI